MGQDPARGQIWWAEVELGEAKRFVIVSNNPRNRTLRDVLGVRMTTAPKPSVPSIVAFKPGEVDTAICYAVADDITPLDKAQLQRPVGALTPRQMRRVDVALVAALGLRDALRA